MTLQKWLADFQAKHGLKHVTPHGLRSTNITMQESNGATGKAIQERAGHADYSTTTKHYVQGTSEGNKKSAVIIDDILTGRKSSQSVPVENLTLLKEDLRKVWSEEQIETFIKQEITARLG